MSCSGSPVVWVGVLLQLRKWMAKLGRNQSFRRTRLVTWSTHDPPEGGPLVKALAAATHSASSHLAEGRHTWCQQPFTHQHPSLNKTQQNCDLNPLTKPKAPASSWGSICQGQEGNVNLQRFRSCNERANSSSSLKGRYQIYMHDYSRHLKKTLEGSVWLTDPGFSRS